MKREEETEDSKTKLVQMDRIVLSVRQCRLLRCFGLENVSTVATASHVYSSRWANSRTCTFVICVLVLSSLAPTSHAACREAKSLEEREEIANVVVSGTVKKIMVDERDINKGLYKSEIEIKRVFKGENIVKQVANGFDQVRQHPMVMVDGFGDPRICDSEIRVADTKIFLLNKGYNGELVLNSSILPITRVNLDYTDAVVKGKVYSFTTKCVQI